MAFVIDTRGSLNFDKEVKEARRGSDPEESDDDFMFIPLKTNAASKSSSKSKDKSLKEDKSLQLDETYPGFREFPKSNVPSVKRSKAIDKHIEKLLEKSATLSPGLEKQEAIPSYAERRRVKLKKRKAERERTKGAKWFNLPAPEITEEIQNDIDVLKMRSALDPKHFYKKNDMKHTPKYFRIGRVVDSPADYYSSRIPKKERKRTFVDDLLADAEFQRQTKRRYKEILVERQKTDFKAVRQTRRQQKKKKPKAKKNIM